jgi:hypothetical protein
VVCRFSRYCSCSSRAINRFIAIKEVYGKKNASFSVLTASHNVVRLICGNVINFFSTLDAWKTFIFGNKRKSNGTRRSTKNMLLKKYSESIKESLETSCLKKGSSTKKTFLRCDKKQDLLWKTPGKISCRNQMVEKKEMDLARAMQLRSYPDELRFEDLDIELIYMIPEAIAKIGKILVIGKLKHSVLLQKRKANPSHLQRSSVKK